MRQPTERHPLRIESGLDGATVLIRVVPVVRDQPWSRRGLLVLTIAVALLGAYWMAILFGALWGGWMYQAHRGPQPEVLHLKVDRSGVQVGGREVQATCDFMTLWLDEVEYTIGGGLTRAECRRLTELFQPAESGDRSEVPSELFRARSQRH